MGKNIKYVSPVAMKSLTEWDWPGDIHELEHFIERSVILTRGRFLEVPLSDLRKINADHHDFSHAVADRADLRSQRINV